MARVNTSTAAKKKALNTENVTYKVIGLAGKNIGYKSGRVLMRSESFITIKLYTK